MIAQGYRTTLVAATLAISRSSLYYRKKPRDSWADRICDEQNVWLECPEAVPAEAHEEILDEWSNERLRRQTVSTFSQLLINGASSTGRRDTI
jgi:hypothetical protein